MPVDSAGAVGARPRARIWPLLGSAGFIDHYITGVMYPSGATGYAQAAAFTAVLVSWVLLAVSARRVPAAGRPVERAEGVSIQIWVLTCVVILGLFVFDFFAHVRVPHEPTFRESALWSTVYIVIAIVFGLVIWWQWGGSTAGVLRRLHHREGAVGGQPLRVHRHHGLVQVPRQFQQKLLLMGIVLALIMRAGFIAVGAAAINAFSWMFSPVWGIPDLPRSSWPARAGHEREAEVEQEDAWSDWCAGSCLPPTTMTVTSSSPQWAAPGRSPDAARARRDRVHRPAVRVGLHPAIYGLTESRTSCSPPTPLR